RRSPRSPVTSHPTLPLSFLPPSSPPPRHLHSFPTRRSSDLSTLCACQSRASGFAISFHILLITSQPNFVACAPQASTNCPVFSRSEEHTSELQSPCNLVCRLLLEKKKMLSLLIHNGQGKLLW